MGKNTRLAEEKSKPQLAPSGSKPDPTGQASQKEFENKIKGKIGAILGKGSALPLKKALCGVLGKDSDETVGRVIGAWWAAADTLTVVRTWYEATEGCLKELSEREPVSRRHPVWIAAREILGHTVTACIRRDWLDSHYHMGSPFHSIPLERIGTIEIFSASVEERPAHLVKSGPGSEVFGEDLLHLERRELAPGGVELTLEERGWPPAETADEAARCIWRIQFGGEGKKGPLSRVDYGQLNTVIRAGKKYLAVDRAQDPKHPLLIPAVCEMLHQKLDAMKIVHFGLVTIEGLDSPLFVPEGDLIGEVWLFLRMIEDYENP